MNPVVNIVQIRISLPVLPEVFQYLLKSVTWREDRYFSCVMPAGWVMILK